MPDLDISVLAEKLLWAFTTGGMIPTPPTARFDDFDLDAAYSVEHEISRLRGGKTVGLKVGFANKALWRVLKLQTLVWAHMYDDTVRYARGSTAELALPYYRSPRIEPEIVFHLKEPIPAPADQVSAVVSGNQTPAIAPAGGLESVDWLAIGFEIIDCPYPEWHFKPPDFVAALGLHLALVIGEPLPVTTEMAAQLATFKVRVSKDGEFVEEGSGKNSLRSPALCLAELASALYRQPGATPLAAGDLVSSGTLTAGHPIGRGESWKVEVEGLPVSDLTLRFS